MHHTLERDKPYTLTHNTYTMLHLYTFIHLLVNTTIISTSDGLYTLSTSDGCTYEYACQGEVVAYFEYGVFMYDDNLCECGELE